MTDGGRFTEAAMTAAMHKIAAHLGMSSDDAQLLRLTNNAVFALPTAGAVIRITRSHVLHDRVQKVARLADWFTTVDAPTIRPYRGYTQPVEADGLLATIWDYVPPTPQKPSVDDLGRVLRRFHTLGTPPFDMPAWDPVSDARRRLTDAEALDDADRSFLTQWCDQLAPRIAELNTRAHGSLIHGDAHVGNLIRDDAGLTMLCDFDATCIGPWQVDLAAVAVGEARFGRAGAHADLTASYGYDVTTDPDWTTLRAARELKMVAAAVPLLASGPAVAGQFQVRLQSIRNRDPHTRWTPFASLAAQAA